MKRCPQCSFLYLDSDEVCDLDGTRLVHASDVEAEASPTPPKAMIAAATQDAPNSHGLETSSIPSVASVAPETQNVSNSRNHPILIAGGGLVLGLLVLLSLGYIALSRRNMPPPQVQQPIAEVIATPEPLASPSPSASLSSTPAPSPLTTERPVPSPSPRVTRATVSNNPVSTSASQASQGSVVIRLTDGSKIEADEVWRTKEGVWYRRSGMVTLLKSGRVKSIEKSARK